MTIEGTAIRPADRQSALAPLVAGIAVLAALWLGPLGPLSHTAFSAHMLLHVGVIAVGSPLLGYAIAVRLPAPATFATALSWCLLAAAVEMVMVWSWHLPLLHDEAGHSTILFVVEQGCFLAGGLALWTAAMAARTRQSAGAAAIALFLTFTHMAMFGLVLTLAPRLLYDPSVCQAAFGMSGLDNQHLGGVVMIAGALPYFAGTGLAVFRLMNQREDRREP
jgi:putative membrane protein